jgi:hypothetical protein
VFNDLFAAYLLDYLMILIIHAAVLAAALGNPNVPSNFLIDLATGNS